MANVETIERPKRKQTDADTLWPALCAAQEKFQPIFKSAKGAHKAGYAPLDVVLEMARPILNEYGLIVTQPTYVQDGTLYVRTMIVHRATGEAHSGEYPAGPFTQSHQQLGAGVTYARRYSLLSILGVFPENEDDDGEKAGAAGGAPHASPPPRQQQPTIRHEAQRFINNAKAKIATAGDDIDAAHAVLDALKELPSWKQLNAAEQAAIREAMPRLPDDAG
jgi:hypothetical protein